MIHCFDYMRQAIMCSADMALEGLETTFPDHNGGSDGWDSKHGIFALLLPRGSEMLTIGSLQGLQPGYQLFGEDARISEISAGIQEAIESNIIE